MKWVWELISNCHSLRLTRTFTSRLDHFFFLHSSIRCADFPPTLTFRILGSTFILFLLEMQISASRREGKGNYGQAQKVLADLHTSKNFDLSWSPFDTPHRFTQCGTPSSQPEVSYLCYSWAHSSSLETSYSRSLPSSVRSALTYSLMKTLVELDTYRKLQVDIWDCYLLAHWPQDQAFA